MKYKTVNSTGLHSTRDIIKQINKKTTKTIEEIMEAVANGMTSIAME